MKDRIQIDGVWYVREIEPETKFFDIEISTSLNAHYENEDYAWEAIRMHKDDNKTFYDGFDVKFTDKNTKPWKEEYWDSMLWIQSVYENDPETINSLSKDINENGIKHFRSFLNELKHREWF
jgi:hypothetical protein